MKALGYVRLSRDSESSSSLDKQRDSIAEHCDRQGWELVRSFEDVDTSGTKGSRPGLDAMLDRLGDADVIVFHRLDRIMRSVVGFAKLLERCRAADVELVSATEPFDTSSATGRALVWLLASVAEIEAENTSKRITATHEHLLRQGRVIGKGRAFGWRHDPDARTFVHVPEEVEAIRAAADALLAGESTNAIARALADGSLTGVPLSGPQGGEMNGMRVREILSSYRLLGFLTRHGQRATTEPTLEPVLDPETFELVQATLRRRARGRVRPRGDYELTGTLVCGVCGERMYHKSSGRGAYGCVRGCVSISQGFIEAELARRLFEHVDRLRLEEYLEAHESRDATDPHRDARAALARLTWGREELLRDYYQEQRLDRETFEAQLAEISERIARYEEKLAGARDDRAVMQGRAAELADLPGMWPRLTVVERREIYQAFCERVTVAKAERRGAAPTAERLDVRWRGSAP